MDILYCSSQSDWENVWHQEKHSRCRDKLVRQLYWACEKDIYRLTRRNRKRAGSAAGNEAMWWSKAQENRKWRGLQKKPFSYIFFSVMLQLPLDRLHRPGCMWTTPTCCCAADAPMLPRLPTSVAPRWAALGRSTPSIAPRTSGAITTESPAAPPPPPNPSYSPSPITALLLFFKHIIQETP